MINGIPDNSLLTCSLELPNHFRVNDILDFHNRDALAVAESVEGYSLRKGLLWNDQTACLTICFKACSADVLLAIDGQAYSMDVDALHSTAKRMLGLTQPVEDFEQSYRQHPQLGVLITQKPGLRVPLSATVFEALSWAIIGQQISVSAAISIRRKLIQTVNRQHSSGLACYPNAKHVAPLSESDLRHAGFSQIKAQTLLAVSRMIVEGKLMLENSTDATSIEALCQQLQQIRGIGPWTINYALLRGIGWLDGSLHGDVVVRRSLQTLLQCADKISEQQAQHWLTPFSPWRALVAAHLWAFTSAGA